MIGMPGDDGIPGRMGRPGWKVMMYMYLYVNHCVTCSTG